MDGSNRPGEKRLGEASEMGREDKAEHGQGRGEARRVPKRQRENEEAWGGLKSEGRARITISLPYSCNFASQALAMPPDSFGACLPLSRVPVQPFLPAVQCAPKRTLGLCWQDPGQVQGLLTDSLSETSPAFSQRHCGLQSTSCLPVSERGLPS